MIEDIKTHFWHYAALIFIVFIGGVSFSSASGAEAKFRVGVLTAVFYVFWGIGHHLLEKNLKAKIVVEYVLIGLLAVIMLGGILL